MLSLLFCVACNPEEAKPDNNNEFTIRCEKGSKTFKNDKTPGALFRKYKRVGMYKRSHVFIEEKTQNELNYFIVVRPSCNEVTIEGKPSFNYLDKKMGRKYGYFIVVSHADEEDEDSEDELKLYKIHKSGHVQYRKSISLDHIYPGRAKFINPTTISVESLDEDGEFVEHEFFDIKD